MSGPARHPDVRTEDVPGTGELVLLHPETRKVLALNATGAAVWELLDGQRGAAALAQVLVDASEEVSLETATADVEALLAELGEQGFLGSC